NLLGHIAQALKLAVGQGHGWCYGDRVASVNTHWVDVLDRTHYHKVVLAVAHYLKLELFPAEYRLLNQYLVYWRSTQATLGDFAEFGFIVCNTTTATTKGKRWTDQHWVADFSGQCHCFINAVYGIALW